MAGAGDAKLSSNEINARIAGNGSFSNTGVVWINGGVHLYYNSTEEASTTTGAATTLEIESVDADQVLKPGPIWKLNDDEVDKPRLKSAASLFCSNDNYRVYFQKDLVIHEASYISGVWRFSTEIEASDAKNDTPIAAVCHCDEVKIHVFYLNKDDDICERCWDPTGGWRIGPLTKHTVKVASNSSLSAICSLHSIKLYCQQRDLEICELSYQFSQGDWTLRELDDAFLGSSIASVRHVCEDKIYSEILTLKRALEEKKRECERLQENNVTHKNDIRGVREQLAISPGLNEALAQAGSEISQAVQDQMRKLQVELAEKQNIIIGLETNEQVMGEFVAEARSDIWRKVAEKESTESQTVDDERLKSDIHMTIGARCKQWAEMYAIMKFDEDSVSLDATLDAELAKTAGRQNDAAALCRKYDPDIVVNALVVQYITENVLNKPFLAVELETHARFAGKMVDELQKHIDVDPRDGYKWRSQQLQLLEPMLPRESGKDDAPIRVDNEKCTILAMRFLDGPARALLKPGARREDTGLRGLKTIMEKAIQVGLLIWKQPLDIHIRGYQHLRVRRFAKELKTHPSQFYLEKRAGENAEMDMVIQPSIVAKQGELAEKVWSQAVVLWSH